MSDDTGSRRSEAEQEASQFHHAVRRRSRRVAARCTAQKSEKVYKIGVFSAGSRSPAPRLQFVFRDGLRELGWIEGKNVAFEGKYSENRLDRLPELAAELVTSNPG
jgi:hypothetical protein